MAAAAVLAATSAGCTPDRPAGLRLAHSIDIPHGYLVTGFAADEEGAWFSAISQSRFLGKPDSGIIGHIAADGQVTSNVLDGSMQYPQGVAVDGKGVVWYAKITAHGLHPTVDSGPGLTDPTTALAWRTRTDKTEHVVALPHPTDSMRTLAADPKGGVWYIDYRFTGDVYGHASADGAVREYAGPGRELSAIAPAGDDAVWLTTAQKCEILKVRPADGTVLARTRDETDTGYRAECDRAEPFPGDGVVVPMWDRLAVVDTNGNTTMRELPAATSRRPGDGIFPEPELAVTRDGVVWAGRANTIPVILYRFDARGSVRAFSVDTGGPGHGLGMLYAGPPGTLWIVGAFWIGRLTES